MLKLSELEFVDAAEFSVVEKRGHGSKYRATVLKFLGSELERALIRCVFEAEADVIYDGLSRWIGVGEPMRVFKRGRIVYLERLSK